MAVGAADTVTSSECETEPSVAVIVAVPPAWVTRFVPSMDTTPVLEEVSVTPESTLPPASFAVKG